ncbi:hypothetical protein STRAU_2021 [Streptomyces aurantiacus JA 4570]|uniref:Uncharacterized protein n=1 Tax=Streptomyces aurantiacus JA 4570 TaxID=1286094 RepID=S3ZQ29_9ACTN|nr:hypothetical protein STRAU_2021 [Streptomyces aurantiacus JA 4570]
MGAGQRRTGRDDRLGRCSAMLADRSAMTKGKH